MYILDVIPLALIPRHQDQLLSYYYSASLPVGAVVVVPLNRRRVSAIIVGSTSLQQRKLIYKKAVAFELKNITKVISAEPLVSDRQLRIAKYLSDYYYAPLGICLKTILPPFFTKKGYSVKGTADSKKNQQKFILIPERIMGEYYSRKYNAGVFVSGDTKNKDYFDIWQKVAGGKVRIIVGTRVGLFLPFANLTELIVEDEANAAYKSDMTPRYHAADLARHIAARYGAQLSLLSPVPRLETWASSQPPAISNRVKAKVVSVVGEIKAGNFSIFSRDLKDAILKFATLNLKLILYIPRRGHANFILCQHCGQILKCPHCTASLVVYKSPEEKLICHHCYYSGVRPKSCPACGAYQFKPYGIGIEKVLDELNKFFKYSNISIPAIFRLDSDSVPDEATEQKIVSDFMVPGPAILITTPMLFSQQPLIKANGCGIISADTLTNIPDFRASESLFRQLYTLGIMADELIIQTRNPDDPTIKAAAAGDVKEFFANELVNRREFGYPPYSQLTKLTYRQRDPARARKEAMILAERMSYEIKIKNYDKEIKLLGPSPAFISQERGQYIWNIIISLERKAQNEKEKTGGEIKKRNELLRLVPNGWVIDVDPRSMI